MNHFKSLLLLTLFLIVRGGYAQDVTQKKQEDFKYFYNKASDLLNKNLDSAYIYATNAITFAEKKQLWSGYFLLGLVHKKKQEYNQGILLYKKAIRLAKRREDKFYVYNNLANTLYEAKRFTEANNYIQKVKTYREEVNHPYLYNTYGVIAKLHSKTHNLDSTQYYYTKAISSIVPTHDKDKQVTASFLATKGDMFVEYNRLDSAIVFYQKAIKLQKTEYKRCEYLLNLADCYAHQSNFATSKKHLEQAKKITSNNFPNQVRLLQITANIQAKKEQRKKLKATYTEIQQLISANADKLTNVDLKMYITIQNEIHQKQQNLAAKAERRVARTAKARMGGIWALLGILVIIATLYFTKLKHKTYPQNHSDNVVKPIRQGLKIAYVGKPKNTEEKELGEFLGLLRKSRSTTE